MTSFTESEVEAAALQWLEGLGWSVAHGPGIAPHTEDAERTDYTEVVLEHRLRGALDRLDPDLPADALDDAFRKITRPEGSTLEARNRAFHRLLVDGVTVEYRIAGGALRGAQVAVIDSRDPSKNDWLASSIRTFAVASVSIRFCILHANQAHRRPASAQRNRAKDSGRRSGAEATAFTSNSRIRPVVSSVSRSIVLSAFLAARREFSASRCSSLLVNSSISLRWPSSLLRIRSVIPFAVEVLSRTALLSATNGPLSRDRAR